MDASWPHTHRAGEPLVLALHGTGGDEHQMTGLVDALLPHAGILAPRVYEREDGRVDAAAFDWSEDVKVTNSAAVIRLNANAA